jgi:hypothetical protein
MYPLGHSRMRRFFGVGTIFFEGLESRSLPAVKSHSYTFHGHEKVYDHSLWLTWNNCETTVGRFFCREHGGWFSDGDRLRGGNCAELRRLGSLLVTSRVLDAVPFDGRVVHSC